MDRQTLDSEGARHGEVSAASLQLGDDTIAILRIATMTIEAHQFTPWDTPRNRQTQGLYATGSIAALFFGLVGIAWWNLAKLSALALPALMVGGALLLACLFLAIQSALMSMKLRKVEPYYRLVIGTSDGRKIPLVDNFRETLIKVRDVVRHKMDTNDRAITGEFDLNADIFRFTAGSLPTTAASGPMTSAAVVAAPIEIDDDEPALPPS
jgi:hypothetical protein